MKISKGTTLSFSNQAPKTLDLAGFEALDYVEFGAVANKITVPVNVLASKDKERKQ